MSDILRSILPDEPRGDDSKLMFQNYCALKESVLRFDLPSEINVFSILIISLCSVSITILVSIFPALKAAKLDPIKTLKYE